MYSNFLCACVYMYVQSINLCLLHHQPNTSLIMNYIIITFTRSIDSWIGIMKLVIKVYDHLESAPLPLSICVGKVFLALQTQLTVKTRICPNKSIKQPFHWIICSLVTFFLYFVSWMQIGIWNAPNLHGSSVSIYFNPPYLEDWTVWTLSLSLSNCTLSNSSLYALTILIDTLRWMIMDRVQ